MPILAQYRFDDIGNVAADTANLSGAQQGAYLNGAGHSAGTAVLDGVDDLVKIFADPSFQLDRGSLFLGFTWGPGPHDAEETILSRDSAGQTPGGFRAVVLADGSIRVSHESATGTTVWTTAAGFVAPGETISISYSWDLGGAGGQLVLTNSTAGRSFEAAVPNTLGMDQGAMSQPWILGAGQANSTPGMLDGVDQHLQGSISHFEIWDEPRVITPPGPVGPRDGIVSGTVTDDLIDTSYQGDPDGDRVDAGDALLPGAGEEDDVIRAGAGNDTVLAGEGNDLVQGGAGQDSLEGGAGNDTLEAGEALPGGREQLFGGAGEDVLRGSALGDDLVGGLGNDVIFGGGAAAGSPDVIDGGAGADRIEATGPGGEIVGGQGADEIRVAATPEAPVQIWGDARYSDPVATGGDRPDVAYPGLYTADADPADNRDVIVVTGSGAAFVAGGDDDDRITTGAGADTVDGGVDDDLIDAGAGDDALFGNEGDDTILAGAGNDVVHGDAHGFGVLNPAPELADGAGDLVQTNNRDQLFGGEGDDRLYGGDDADTEHGGAGNDLVSGGLDADRLSGDAGDDMLVGGEGNDTLEGGAGVDLAYGGADRDVFVVARAEDGFGDVLDGEGTGDDFDRLDLTGAGPYRLVDLRADADGNGQDGTVEFLDASGAVTGQLRFVNIEQITAGTPDARPDAATTPEGQPVTIAVLGNDVDPDGQPLTVISAVAENGTVTINPDGTLRYQPDADYNGPDTITYVVRDPDGNTDTTTVAVTVTPVNDAPTAVDESSTTPINTPITRDVLANDLDVDGDALTIQGTPTATGGRVAVTPDGRLVFTPDPGFTGTAQVDYTVVDPEGLTDTARWTITVGSAANLPPVAVDDLAQTVRDTPVTIPVLANDSDPEGNPLAVLGTPVSPDGTVVVNPDGTLTFTPNPGFTGPARITYVIGDGLGGTDTGEVIVTVLPDGAGPDGIVRGTAAGDLIGPAYVDPTDGDRVDANDQILPGAEPNDDLILAGAGNDTVLAGEGDDSVEGGTGDDLISGQEGADTLLGQDGNDSLNGGAGNDVILGGHGNDTALGDAGDDLIDTSGDPTPLPDIDYPGIYPADGDPADDRDLVEGGAGNDTIRTGDDADTIRAGLGNDLVDAGFDADLVDAGAGEDTVIGAEGSDTISAGAGNDLVYGGYGPGVPDAVNIPDAAGDLRPTNGRDVIDGGSGDDTLYGMDDDDSLIGGLGNDVLDGGIDEDRLDGGAGNDILSGGQGNDTLDGGAGNDLLQGGSGVDVLAGGDDRDLFLVGSANDALGDVIDGGAGGDDLDRLDLTGAGPFRIVGLRPDSDGNGQDGTVEFLNPDGTVRGQLDFTNIEEIVPCFTPGALIATPRGEVPVEMLRAGDAVLTRDNGIQHIRWIGRKDLGWQELDRLSHLRPILIKAGSLGHGLPERDLLVSPNHRMLVANDRTALYFDEHEVLVAAKHLVSGSAIGSVSTAGVSYIHFMFDRHEVVLANGAWTESFQPGDYSLKGLANSQRAEILELFPELKTAEGLADFAAARKILKRHEAVLLSR